MAIPFLSRLTQYGNAPPTPPLCSKNMVITMLALSSISVAAVIYTKGAPLLAVSSNLVLPVFVVTISLLALGALLPYKGNLIEATQETRVLSTPIYTLSQLQTKLASGSAAKLLDNTLLSIEELTTSNTALGELKENISSAKRKLEKLQESVNSRCEDIQERLTLEEKKTVLQKDLKMAKILLKGQESNLQLLLSKKAKKPELEKTLEAQKAAFSSPAWGQSDAKYLIDSIRRDILITETSLAELPNVDSEIELLEKNIPKRKQQIAKLEAQETELLAKITNSVFKDYFKQEVSQIDTLLWKDEALVATATILHNQLTEANAKYTTV